MTESELMAREELYDILSNSPSLQTNPQLAVSIGVNRTIILQQIMYWLRKNEEKGINNFNGHYWCYNSVNEWKVSDFPFFSESTIDRCIDDLTKAGILIASKTRENGKVVKWLTVDYKVILKYQTGEQKIEKHSRDLSGKKNRNESKVVDLTNTENIEKVKLTNPNSSIRPNENSHTDETDLVNQTKTDIYYIYNNISAENTTKNTNKDYGTEITKTEEEKKIEEKAGTNVPTQKKAAEVAPYIILPDTEESKPCESNQKRKYELYDMFDNCRIKAMRKFNLCDSDAKYVSKIIEHFCTKYHEKTKMFHGVVKGECLDKIIEFTIGELMGKVDVIEDMDRFLEEMQNESGRCQITDFVNRRMAS